MLHALYMGDFSKKYNVAYVEEKKRILQIIDKEILRY